MELIAIGFLMGVVVVLIVFIIALDGKIKDIEKAVDRDVKIYIPQRNKGHTTKEMIEVLQILRMNACKYEKEILNEIIDLIGKGE